MVVKALKKFRLVVYLWNLLLYLNNRYIVHCLFRNSYTYRNVSLVELSTSRKSESFFGYYNISPFNKNNDVLFCESKYGNYSLPLNLMLYNLISEKYQMIGETYTWNWQQGCMLQWYANSNHQIIYNNFSTSKNKYVSIIQNVETGEKQEIVAPIYSVAKSGKFGLTLNFERLALMRPDYGYFNRKIFWQDLPNDENDGIWYIDIQNNTSKFILSLETLKNYQPTKTMGGAKHKVNHIEIAPNEKRFMFLHRWVGPQGRFMRLLTASSIDGSDLFSIIGDDMVSHNCWLGINEIISFCRLKDGRDCYVRFKDEVGFIEIIGEEKFYKDGHPSISPDGKWLLTDDYPDKARYSRLYLYHLKNKKKYLIGKFYQPLKYKGEKRIDLHPKWSPDGKRVSVDSGHVGLRKIYSINLDSLKFNE